MKTFSECARRVTTFFLAIFLWLHALFFLNVRPAVIAKGTQLLRLTGAELVLFALLLTFSFLAASGFWKTVGSMLYIYFFPFVLIVYGFRWSFLLIRSINGWLKAQSPTQLDSLPATLPSRSAIIPSLAASSESGPGAKQRFAEVARFLLRPFRRFTALWCILLLVSTHAVVVRLCLTVVLVHLATRLFILLQILLSSGSWLKKIGDALPSGLLKAFQTLTDLVLDAAPENELQKLWNELRVWKKILEFFKDPYLISRWAWILGVFLFGLMYIYIALLFSFAYYGIARVAGVSYSWLDALVTSVFIPFFISDLPKIMAIKVLAGIHCSLVVMVGIGTVMNFMRRRLDAIRRAATELSDRFSDQNISEKYVILEAKFSPSRRV